MNSIKIENNLIRSQLEKIKNEFIQIMMAKETETASILEDVR